MHPYNKFYENLPTNIVNALNRYNSQPGGIPIHPWDMSIKELLKIPGIGIHSITIIATLAKKYCL